MRNSIKKNRTRRFYISPLTIIFLLVAAASQSLRPTLIAYMVAFLHEGAHFAAASFFDIGFSSISIMPFGLSIRLKKEYIEDPQKEFWICFAGPFANIALFTIGLMIKSKYQMEGSYMHFFLSANMMMFFLNMLPILPLDGGRMLKSMLTDNYGAIKAFNFTFKIGKMALLVFFAVMCYILYTEKFNLSFIILFAFLFYSIFSEKTKNNLFLMREMMNSVGKMDEKRIMKINHIAVAPDYDAIRLIEKFSYNTFTVLSIIENKKAESRPITEIQIIEGMINLGTKAKVADIFDFYS